MTPESHWTTRLIALFAGAIVLWVRMVRRPSPPIPLPPSAVNVSVPESRLSDRELAIRGFTKAMHEQWETGNVDMASFIEKRITALEDMTDTEYNRDYEDRVR